MKRFLKKLILFLTPFAIGVLAILFVDPYNFFGWGSLVRDEIKKPISNLHYPLWKMPEFRRKPVANILLGDSRMNALDASLIQSTSQEEYYNFAYGGATLQEVISTFWYASSITQLKKVFIGVNFNLYNGLSTGDRTQDFRNISANPVRYFVHPSVLKATWYDILASLGKRVEIGVPDMDPERFWRFQLDEIAGKMYRRYEPPTHYVQELIKLTEYCRTSHIDLAFVVFPTHTDLQKRIGDFGLEAEQQACLAHLAKLAPVYDYDFPNAITRDKANFKDPFHYRKEIMALLVQDLWGSKRTLPRRGDPPDLILPAGLPPQSAGAPNAAARSSANP